ncbi:MAG: nucleotidyl transferase AbiEii/AbiGii toxin family protein [Patescibacteria group bacterium]|nr:nucleotidyl transferase AbiEii/AbiGii toxin family protein [Patescibacteria group bacterium]
MGKDLLTSKQFDFLELTAQKKEIIKRFYLTGGSALAAFYLNHRISKDLDFFSEKEEIPPKIVEAFLKKISSQLGIVKIERSQFLGLFSYYLIYSDKESLKVDFNYYPFPRIEKGKIYKGLEIASIYDIAVDKLHTLFMKPRGRDYVDLYFILKEKNYPLKKLILDAKAKFDWDIDKLNLAAQFLRVKDFEEILEMRKPFKRNEMEEFFMNEVKKLKKEIFK